MNFETYPMPIDDRFSNSSYIIEHWKMMVTISAIILIIGLVLTLYSLFKKEESVIETIGIVTIAIGVVTFAIGIIIIILISGGVSNAYRNILDMHMHHYS